MFIFTETGDLVNLDRVYTIINEPDEGDEGYIVQAYCDGGDRVALTYCENVVEGETFITRLLSELRRYYPILDVKDANCIEFRDRAKHD